MTFLQKLSWPTVEHFQTIAGVLYRVADGNLYTWPDNVLSSSIYDPLHVETQYKTLDSDKYKYNSVTGDAIKLKRSYTEDFSGFETLAEALQPGTNFTNATFQGPKHTTAALYVPLKNRIVKGTSDFVDCRVDFVDDIVQTENWPFLCLSDRAGECCIEEEGQPKYARFLSVKPGEQFFLTKSSILNENLFYSKGDTVSIKLDVYLQEGQIGGLIDLECSYIYTSPGIRILCSGTGEMRVELKWGDKPTWRQSGTPVLLQKGSWTSIKFDNYLHETTGWTKLYINNVLVISGVGQTIPVPDAVYDRIEIGISTNNQPADCVLFVKNLDVSAT